MTLPRARRTYSIGRFVFEDEGIWRSEIMNSEL
jgi:hypothetical protein